jgi:hypothetical protein
MLKISKDKQKKGNDLGWNNPDVLDVNLIKDEMGVSFHWQKALLKAVVLLVIAAGFITEIYISLGRWEKKEQEKANQISISFKEVSQQMRDIKDETDQVTAFKDKLDLINELVANHVYWSHFFDWLERRTLNSVNYYSFTGDISGQYSISASAASYADISWQVKSFMDDTNTVSAQVDSGSSEEGTDDNGLSETKVNFDLKLKVNPDIFYNK